MPRSPVVKSVPLLPVPNWVHFPSGEVRLKVSHPGLMVLLDEIMQTEAPMVGIITQFPTASASSDRDLVRRHLRLGLLAGKGLELPSDINAEAPLTRDSVFERIPSHSRSDNEEGVTDWRCGEVGTLVKLLEVTPIVEHKPIHNTGEYHPRSKHLGPEPMRKELKPPQTKEVSSRVVVASTLNRFRVTNYNRTLLGFWEADCKVLPEAWGAGGRRKASMLMSQLQSSLKPQLLTVCDGQFRSELLETKDPLKFSYLIPQMLPTFGVSSVVNQALLECTTCVGRLSMEQILVNLLSSVFSKRMQEHVDTAVIKPHLPSVSLTPDHTHPKSNQTSS